MSFVVHHVSWLKWSRHFLLPVCLSLSSVTVSEGSARHPQRRAPSFTIPRNVGEGRFIRAGAMDPDPIPPLSAVKREPRLQLVSKTTTQVVLASRATDNSKVIETPQKVNSVPRLTR